MATFFCWEFMFGNEVSPPLPPFDMIFALVFLLPKHGISFFSSYYNIPNYAMICQSTPTINAGGSYREVLVMP